MCVNYNVATQSKISVQLLAVYYALLYLPRILSPVHNTHILQIHVQSLWETHD